MKKILILAAILPFALTSCVSKKKFSMLEAREKATQDLLNSTTVKLNMCLSEKEKLNLILKTNKLHRFRQGLYDGFHDGFLNGFRDGLRPRFFYL